VICVRLSAFDVAMSLSAVYTKQQERKMGERERERERERSNLDVFVCIFGFWQTFLLASILAQSGFWLDRVSVCL